MNQYIVIVIVAWQILHPRFVFSGPIHQPGPAVIQPGPAVIQPGPAVIQPGPAVIQPGPAVFQDVNAFHPSFPAEESQPDPSFSGLDMRTSNTLLRQVSVGASGMKHHCSICGLYSSDRRANLNRHLKIHTRETPFLCSVGECSYRSINLYNVDRHRFWKHGIPWPMRRRNRGSHSTAPSTSSGSNTPAGSPPRLPAFMPSENYTTANTSTGFSRSGVSAGIPHGLSGSSVLAGIPQSFSGFSVPAAAEIPHGFPGFHLPAWIPFGLPGSSMPAGSPFGLPGSSMPFGNPFNFLGSSSPAGIQLVFQGTDMPTTSTGSNISVSTAPGLLGSNPSTTMPSSSGQVNRRKQYKRRTPKANSSN